MKEKILKFWFGSEIVLSVKVVKNKTVTSPANVNIWMKWLNDE